MRTTIKAIVAATILLSFYVSAVSQQVAKSIPNSTSPDGIIGFLQFTPSDYGSQKHPLIIFLHGIGERGNGTTQLNSITANAIPKFCAAGASMRFTVGGKTSSFVVLSPQLSVQYGSWPTFYVKEMIKYAKANLQIDPNRIYVCGLSLGGGGVWDVITEATGSDYSFDATIAAAAPVCGTQEESDANFCKTIGANHLPVWAFHSMDDGTVSVNATQHAELLGTMCGNTPASKFTYYQSGGHGGAWVHAYDTGHITVPVVVNGVVSNFTASPNLYEWFLSNTRNITTTNTAPLASAGATQIITLPVSTVTLTGTGTGTNGATIASYSWTKTSGPAGGTISVPLLNTTLVTGLVQGTYVFTLTVTDSHGLTATSTVTITVNPLSLVNTVPVANAGIAQTITLPATVVTLTGTGSGTNGATISSYSWVKTSGPATGTISSATAASTTVTGLAQGTYVFTLTVKDNHALTGSASVTITVNAASSTSSPNQPIGYVKQVLGLYQACQDASSTGRIAVYTNGSSVINGSLIYLDAAHTKIYNGGYNWFSYTPVLNGAATAGFAIFPDGSVKQMSSCGTTTTPPVTTQPVTGGSILGYIKTSVGPYQACDDASSTGRTAVYGSSVANGITLYTDAAKTKVYNGGWNWFSFTPVAGGATTYAFAVYPNGGILLLRNCSTGGSSRVADASATTAEEDIATLKRMKDSATAADAIVTAKDNALKMYPNPVHTNATIELTSATDGYKTINIYNANGVLKAKYTWQTIKGYNIFSLKDVPSLTNGLYIIEVRDYNGKPIGSLKFIKM